MQGKIFVIYTENTWHVQTLKNVAVLKKKIGEFYLLIALQKEGQSGI